MPRIALYPGSFDPVTNGHLDIVRRGLKLFDRVVVAILINPKKQFLFPLEDRLDMLRTCMQDFAGVEVDAFNGLLVDYASRRGAHAILRGLRKPVREMPEGCEDSPWRRLRDEWRLAIVIWRNRRSEPEREYEIISKYGQHAVFRALRSKTAAREFLDALDLEETAGVRQAVSSDP